MLAITGEDSLLRRILHLRWSSMIITLLSYMEITSERCPSHMTQQSNECLSIVKRDEVSVDSVLISVLCSAICR